MKQENSMDEQLIVCGKPYRILRLLGHGKGGYSYLAEAERQQVVIKQIHHEPCDYYTFGDKIEAERREYERLQAAGIRIPRMLAIDPEAERIVKEYIDGPTVFELVRGGEDVGAYAGQAAPLLFLPCMAKVVSCAQSLWNVRFSITRPWQGHASRRQSYAYSVLPGRPRRTWRPVWKS